MVVVAISLTVLGGCGPSGGPQSPVAAVRNQTDTVPFAILPRHWANLARRLPVGPVKVTVLQQDNAGEFTAEGRIDLDTCESEMHTNGITWARVANEPETVTHDGKRTELLDFARGADPLHSILHLISREGLLEQRGPLCSLNLLPALVDRDAGTVNADGTETFFLSTRRLEDTILAGSGRRIAAMYTGTTAALTRKARELADETLAGIGRLDGRTMTLARDGETFVLTETYPGGTVVFTIEPLSEAVHVQAAGEIAPTPDRVVLPAEPEASRPSPSPGQALIGDSLTAKSIPFMSPERVDAIAVGPVYGRNGLSVYELLDYDVVPLGELPTEVVLALGTVDMRMQTPVRQREYAIELLNRLGPARRVIWVDTLSGPGKQFETLPVSHRIPELPHLTYNLMLDDLSDRYPNMTVARWGAYADNNKIMLWEDGIHLYEDGYRARAEFLTGLLDGR